MPFHRLTVPTYFGGLPAGYDYANNTISGTPAPVDGVKASGPNAGTYFHAFGEDGTSKNANRVASALAQNTDFLDDLMRRDIATVAVTADALAFTPASSIELAGPGVFLGAVGTPDSAVGINNLIKLLDEDDKEIIDENGTHCMVTALDGGAVGSGLFSEGGVTLTITPPIPAGTTYRLYYGTRSNLATMPVDALTSLKIRSAETVSALLEGPGGAALIGYAGAPAWADATTNPATTVEGQLDKIVSDLAEDGTSRIGAIEIEAINDGPYSLTAGPLVGQLTSLLENDTFLREDAVRHQAYLTPLVSVAALKAVTDQIVSDLRFVIGVGLFQFDSASVVPENLPSVVAPDVGPGRWIKIDGAPVAPPTISRHIHLLPFKLATGWQLTNTPLVLAGPATTTAIEIPFDPHDGATLASLDVYIRTEIHANVPAVLPSVNILREAMNLGMSLTAVTFLRLAGAESFPTPASGVLYTNGGLIQKWTYTTDQYNVIDRAAYKYRVSLVDESGADSVANNLYVGMIANYAGIVDMRFP